MYHLNIIYPYKTSYMQKAFLIYSQEMTLSEVLVSTNRIEED